MKTREELQAMSDSGLVGNDELLAAVEESFEAGAIEQSDVEHFERLIEASEEEA